MGKQMCVFRRLMSGVRCQRLCGKLRRACGISGTADGAVVWIASAPTAGSLIFELLASCNGLVQI
jgi:hypothetical protein